MADKSIQEVARALKEGKMPTTAQAVRSLESIKETVAESLNRPDVSQSGKQVLEKTERILDDTKKVIIDKNPDNELQELIASMRNLHFADVSDMESVQQSYGQLGEDARSAICDIVQLTNIIARSGEFRRGLHDVIDDLGGLLNVLQGVTAESVETVEGVVNESSARLPEIPSTKKPENKEEAERMVQETGERAGEATRVLGQGIVKVTEKLSDSGEKLTETLKSFDETKLRDIFLKLKDSWKQLISRDEWQSSVESLSRTLNRISERITQTFKGIRRMNAEDELAQVSDSDRHHLEMIQQNSVKLLQNLASGYSLEHLTSSFKSLIESSLSDENLMGFFEHVQDYFGQLMTDPSFVDSPEFLEQGHQLADLTKTLDPESFGQFRQVLNDLREFMLAIANDKLLNQYAQDWTDLMASLFLDENGRPTLKPELFYDTTLISKLIAERIKYLPVEEIVHSDEEYDYALSNMKLAITDVMPSYARLRYTSRLDLSKSPKAQHFIEIKLTKIQTHAKDIRFWYSKKTIPKVSDQGLLSLTTGEQGLTLRVDIVPALDDSQHFFHVARVHASIPDMDFEVSEAKHEMLYTILSPFLRQIIRSKIEEEIEKQLTASLLKLDRQIHYLMEATRDLDRTAAVRQGMDQPLPDWSSSAAGVPQSGK